MRYIFQNPETEEYHHLDCSYDEMQEFRKEHPDFHQIMKMNLGDAVRMGVTQLPGDFAGTLAKMADNIPGNTIREHSKFKIPKW